mgnify:CR=1 FL=1
MVRKKKQGVHRAPLTILQIPLLMILLLIPVTAFQQNVWVFKSHALHLPLHVGVFEDFFQLLGGSRIAFPHALMPLVTTILTFLGPFFLLLLFYCLVIWLPIRQSLASLLGFAVCIALTPFARAGDSPHLIAHLWITVFILSLLFESTPGTKLWILGTFAVAASFLFESLKPLTAWVLLSFAFGQIVNFIFVNRLSPARKDRLRLPWFSLEWVGTVLFAIWVLVTLLRSPLPENYFGPSPLYTLSFVTGALCVLNCWLNPWVSEKWLTLATLSQGALIFRTLDTALWIVTAYASIALLDYFISKILPENFEVPRWGARLSSFFTLISLVIIGWLMTTSAPSQRQLRTDWVDVSRFLEPESTRGLLVVGSGLPFVATFHPGVVATKEDILLEANEDKFVHAMESLHTSKIVIEEAYLKQQWSSWIEAGRSPQVINRSILSKLVNYQGKAIKTPTLSITALERFKVINSEDIPKGFLIVDVLPPS